MGVRNVGADTFDPQQGSIANARQNRRISVTSGWIREFTR